MKKRKFTKPPIPRDRADRRANDERVKKRERCDHDNVKRDKPTIQQLRVSDMEYMESKMQQFMENADEQYNELVEEFNPPDDWESPNWDEYEKVHCWRNYANDGIQREWGSFSGRQKIIVSSALQSVANNESWN